MKIPIHLALDATHATLFDADAAPDTISVATDTRTLQPGDAFLALRGERFNGHDYTAEAVRKGAAVIVIDEPQARIDGTATMLVDRTLPAYMALARVARERFTGRVVAITGSAGKTTTKALLLQLLAGTYGDRAIAAPANENNEIGVSALLLRADADAHDVIVVEMGARRPGDIATLVDVAQPHLGILTNIGDAHVEIMGSRAVLETTKWALFGRGARAVLNACDAASTARFPSLAEPPHWFYARDGALEPPAVGRTTALLGSATLLLDDGAGTQRYDVDVRLPGEHNRANLAAALAAARELGVSLDDLRAVLPGLHLPAGRFETIRLDGRPRIIYDAYNANAAGTIAALDAFAQEAGARRIALLGSMAELGDEAPALHERVGAHAFGRADVLLVGGEFAEALARGAERAGFRSSAVVRVRDNHEAAGWLRTHASAADVVLLKASRKYRLEEIVEELRT